MGEYAACIVPSIQIRSNRGIFYQKSKSVQNGCIFWKKVKSLKYRYIFSQKVKITPNLTSSKEVTIII